MIGRLSRRGLLAGAGTLLAGAASSLFREGLRAEGPPREPGRAPRPDHAPSAPDAGGGPRPLRGGPILLRGGCVLTMDPELGDFDSADVLIEGSQIAAVGPDLPTPEGADILDASRMIVIPGFVDTHRHMWQGALRNILPDGLLADYAREILGTARGVFTPEDARIGNLVSALGAINAGVTTLLDWSHIGNTPEHTDAAIGGLRDAGVRAVYAYGGGTGGPQNRFPEDIHRLRTEQFASPDQLLTLAMAAGISASQWALAREVDAPISVHVNGTNQLLPVADAMGPDVTYIHCPNLASREWELIRDTGGGVSIAAPIEMQMGHGEPPIQQALDHGIRPSLSTDVETQMTSEFFTQMRSVFTLQRMKVLSRQRAGEEDLPELLTVRDVLEFGTAQGARDNHLEHRIGTLTPGKEADLVLLRRDDINVMPVNDAYGAVVLGMDTSNVDTVFIAGELRKWGGELVAVDLERVRSEAHASRDGIVARAGWPESLVDRG